MRKTTPVVRKLAEQSYKVTDNDDQKQHLTRCCWDDVSTSANNTNRLILISSEQKDICQSGKFWGHVPQSSMLPPVPSLPPMKINTQ